MPYCNNDRNSIGRCAIGSDMHSMRDFEGMGPEAGMLLMNLMFNKEADGMRYPEAHIKQVLEDYTIYRL